MTQTTREEGDPTYDPLDNGGMCGVFVVMLAITIIVISIMVFYAR